MKSNISNLITTPLQKDFPEALNLWLDSAKKTPLGEYFQDNPIFFEAFTHKSFQNENSALNFNYERLEFLGDSLLQTWCSQTLYSQILENEGVLSVMRSAIVSEKNLSDLAKLLNFHELILLGRGEVKCEGYFKTSVLSDVFESFLGACFIYYGKFEVICEILNKVTEMALENHIHIFSPEFSEGFDEKTKLQNLVMKYFESPPYYESRELKDEEMKYEVKLFINQKEVLSKKSQNIKHTQKELAQLALTQKLYQR